MRAMHITLPCASLHDLTLHVLLLKVLQQVVAASSTSSKYQQVVAWLQLSFLEKFTPETNKKTSQQG
jgi:hypothetical protein